MREKTLKKVITFNSTTDAIAFEKYCHDKEIPGRLIPVPREISASCGICWAVPVEDAPTVEKSIEDDGSVCAGVYELML